MSQRFEVRELGAGPPVVLLHGCPTPPALSSLLARPLSREFRTLAVALPGYGGTPAWPGAYDLPGVHQALEDELLRRGAGEAALIGFSAGAYHALALGVRARLRVRGIVSLGGFAGLPPGAREANRGFARMIAAGAALGSLARARFLSPRFAASHPEVAEEVERWADATTPETLVAELNALAESEDLEPRIGALDARILCRVGALDQACPVERSAEIVRRARRGTLEIVPGAGHALLHEDLEATLRSVRGALRACWRGGRAATAAS